MKEQILRSFPPCPTYDITGMESWLDDMAKEGWQLTGQSMFGYFLFRKFPPQTVHYRLEVVVNPQSAWDGDPKTPRDEALALHEEFGWQFVMRFGEFFLYKSTDPIPRELHTDPEVQALTLKMLGKRLRNNLFSSFLIAAFHVLFGVFGCPFAIAMVMGTPFLLLLILLTLAWLAGRIRDMVRIRQTRRALLGGQPAAHRKDWKKAAHTHRFLRVASLVLTLCLFLYGFAVCIDRKIETPLSDVSGSLPFVTLEELLPSDGSITLDKIDNSTCEVWSDPLYPVIYDFLDGGLASHGDGTGTGGLLEVQYCEAASPWLAIGAAKDFARFYHRQTRLYKSSCEMRPLPELGLDYAVGFYNQFGLIRVVLAEGNTAVCARFSMDDEANFTIEHWTQLMAQRMQGA